LVFGSAQLTFTGNVEENIMAKAMFGAGCFWGIETAFRGVGGVSDVAVG